MAVTSNSSCSAQAPRSAYLHVPFCRHRCGYCNFTVVAGRDELVTDYLRALRCELEQLKQPRPVDTLFVGGGTPTRLPLSAWQELLDLITQWFPLTAGGEWTVEANPEDIDAARIFAATEAGVTRWSLGIQSFHPAKRVELERIHDHETIDRAVEICRAAAPQLACDLIFAAPGETPAMWEFDLSELLARPFDHVSTYGLTVEKGTAFWGRRLRGDLSSVGEESERTMYLAARRRLLQAGWEHYEISNFARPGCRCRHNEVYWSCGEYYAAGPGAARYVGGVREVNHRSTTTWIKRLLRGESPVAEREVIDPELAARERLIFGLRRLEGIDTKLFAASTGTTVEQIAEDTVSRHVESGWLEQCGTTLRLTEAGLLISDSLWPDFLA